jgi:hypothetical protein
MFPTTIPICETRAHTGMRRTQALNPDFCVRVAIRCGAPKKGQLILKDLRHRYIDTLMRISPYSGFVREGEG